MHSFESAVEESGMTGARAGMARPDITGCITASLRCQASCEASMARLLEEGHPADSDIVRLLRQCAELCELNARALAKDSRLAKRTASICFELGSQVARTAWLDSNASSAGLARDALFMARACRLMLFAT